MLVENAPEAAGFRFGDFHLDVANQELKRNGAPLHLQPQPLRVLVLLVKNAGQLVTREELYQALWSEGTFVDFDQGLNYCVRQIRIVLRDDAQNPIYIQTVPRRGYRFLAPAKRLVGEPKVARLMLAVLPFANLSAEPDLEYLTDGLTEEMIMQLGALDGRKLGVIARTSVMRYKGGTAGIDQVGRELGVDFVIEGSLRRVGEHMRITAHLIRVKDRTRLWGSGWDLIGSSNEAGAKMAVLCGEEPCPVGDLLTFQTEVSRSIASQVHLSLAPHMPALPLPMTTDTLAHEAFLKGLFFRNRLTPDFLFKSVDSFEQATARDPQFALAHAGLAGSFILLADTILAALPPREAMEQSRRAARKAILIEPALSRAQACLAIIAWRFDWNWKEAQSRFRKARDSNPNCSDTRMLYSWFLTASGNLDAALAEIEQARRLDPVSLMINSVLGWILIVKKEYAQASRHLEQVLELDARFGLAWHAFGLSLLKRGEFGPALDSFGRACELLPDSPYMMAALGHGYAVSGEPSRAEKILQKLLEMSAQRLVPWYTIAMVQAGLKENVEAIRSLQRAIEEKEGHLVYLDVEPIFDSLRADNSFRQLREKVGLGSLPILSSSQ